MRKLSTKMADHSVEMAMAAAVAAAAELAKNGGIDLFDGSATSRHATREAPIVSSPEPEKMEETCLNNESTNDGHSNDSSECEIDGVDHQDIHHVVEEEEDAEKRLARSRERNREHARRTRLRKKAQLEALQDKAKGLEHERKLLIQSIEECSIANILVGLSGSGKAIGDKSVTNTLIDATNFEKSVTPKVSLVVGGKRKRFVSEESSGKTPQPLKLNIDGKTTLIGGGKTNINWKSGVYSDENGVQRQLTQQQLEGLRRERNRMHAKMTRDRKKCFISAVEKTIDQLESDNKRMRTALATVAKHHFGPNAVTPLVSSVESSPEDEPMPEMKLGKAAILVKNTVTPTRVPHGF